MPSLTYSGLARVYNVTVEGDDYREPGDVVSVRACWEALQPMMVDYTVFVHLLGPDNSRAAERHTYPGLGRYPTSMWETGTSFCETYALHIEEWADTPVLYQLEIGLFNADTGERLRAVNALGSAQEPPVLGSVPVISPPANGAPGNAIHTTFEDQIALTGVDYPLSGEAGQSIQISLYWHALSTPEAGLTTFVHLWQPPAIEPIAQDDSIPNQGWFPTDVWRKNFDVTDTHPIDIPDNIPPGVYPIWAGVYRAEDGTRLTAVGPEGPWLNNLVQIGEISIK